MSLIEKVLGMNKKMKGRITREMNDAIKKTFDFGLVFPDCSETINFSDINNEEFFNEHIK